MVINGVICYMINGYFTDIIMIFLVINGYEWCSIWMF